MKRLHIQVQPERCPSLDVNRVIGCLSQLSEAARITEGEDDGVYFNVDFQANDLLRLWEEVQSALQDVPVWRKATIVACEGERGWTDYLLLHHFDPSEPTDTLD